jgi:lipoprotein-anchoring transpeptidase ErfK/SrfK
MVCPELSIQPFLRRKVGLLAVLLMVAMVLPGWAQSEGETARKKQTPAKELIKKQAQPKVIPRVLQRATPESTRLHISLGKQRAWLFVGDEIAIDTPVSTGKKSGMTPKGEFTVIERVPNHRSNIYGSFVDRQGRVVRSGVSTKIDSAPSGTTFLGAPMKYFMRLTWTGIGLHVGHLPGYPASHGCIRLPEDIARLIYENTKLGTVVTIGD